MQDKLTELDIIKEKINNKIDALKADDALENALINLSKGIDELEQYQKVTVDPLVKTKKRGILGKLTVFFKRLCRKIVAWYLQPVCDDQTRYNQQVCMLITAMAAQIDEYQKKQKEFEYMLNKMDYEIDLLRRCIEKV